MKQITLLSALANLAGALAFTAPASGNALRPLIPIGNGIYGPQGAAQIIE